MPQICNFRRKKCDIYVFVFTGKNVRTREELKMVHVPMVMEFVVHVSKMFGHFRLIFHCNSSIMKQKILPFQGVLKLRF